MKKLILIPLLLLSLGIFAQSYTRRIIDLGMPTVGRPITATLYVSPDGDNSDGSSWAKAYTTINSALDAASTDANDLTAILLAPATYNINTTGDPTWSANVEILGSHRRWAILNNMHASATSILKLTGQASVTNLAFGQTGAVNGIILTNSAFRIRKCGFNSSACTSAVKGIHLDGSAATLIGGLIEDVRIIGHTTYTTGFYVNNVQYSDFKSIDSHGCLVGIDILHASTLNNFFTDSDLGGCATGIKIQASVMSMHFYNINFHENTANVDDNSSEHHHWNNINSELPTILAPTDLTGTEISCGNDEWGSDTEIRSAASATKPFKVVGYRLAPSNDETTMIRFSADSGTTFFTQDVFASKKDKATAGGAASDFIFNVGTRISASVYSPDTGRTINVWLEIQEI